MFSSQLEYIVKMALIRAEILCWPKFLLCLAFSHNHDRNDR